MPKVVEVVSDEEGPPGLVDEDPDAPELVKDSDDELGFDDGLSEWALKEETSVEVESSWEAEEVKSRKRRRVSRPMSVDCWLALAPAILIPILLLLGSYEFCLDSLEMFAGCAS